MLAGPESASTLSRWCGCECGFNILCLGFLSWESKFNFDANLTWSSTTNSDAASPLILAEHLSLLEWILIHIHLLFLSIVWDACICILSVHTYNNRYSVDTSICPIPEGGLAKSFGYAIKYATSGPRTGIQYAYILNRIAIPRTFGTSGSLSGLYDWLTSFNCVFGANTNWQ